MMDLTTWKDTRLEIRLKGTHIQSNGAKAVHVDPPCIMDSAESFLMFGRMDPYST